jgi:hypothetical protein
MAGAAGTGAAAPAAAAAAPAGEMSGRRPTPRRFRRERGMSAHAAHADHGTHHEQSFFHKYLWSTDHKMIGMQYLFTGMFMALIGGIHGLRVPDAAGLSG